MRLTFIIAATIIHFSAIAQENDKPKIYNPSASAELQIKDAVAKARKEDKHVLLQIGGNWCIWCIRFHNFVNSDTSLSNLQDKNYITAHINYSDENKNDMLMQRLEYPNRFGFPVFVILDATGKRIHTQNSAYLEEGKGYNQKKVAEFLTHWSPAALNPASYKK